MGHIRLNGVGTGDDTADPAEWLNDLVAQVAQLGAPVRHYHLQDLVTSTWETTGVFDAVKLAIFPNAFLLPASTVAAVHRFVSSGNRTAVWYYAPGVVSSIDGAINTSGVSDVIGCPLVRGQGNRSMTSVFVPPPPPSSRPDGLPAFDSIAGLHYGPTFSGNPGPGVLDPWFYLDEGRSNGHDGGKSSSGGGGPQCVVLARYDVGGQASAVWVDAGGHSTVFTAAPLPSAALRLLAISAGVHIYVDTAVANDTSCTGDGVDVGGAGVLLRGGPGRLRPTQPIKAARDTRSSSSNRTVVLPNRPQGWSVSDEDGAIVCSGCTTFSVALDPGDTRLFICLPSNTSTLSNAL
jgi:hypothetical protein